MIKIYGKISLMFFLCIIVGFCYSQPCSNPVTSNCSSAIAGTSDFLMSTPGNVDFEFNDMQKYVTGITHSGSTQLRLKVAEINPGGCKWKLMMYVDNNGHLPNNEWEPLSIYGSSGNNPELNLIQVDVYNGCRTPLKNGIYQTFIGNVQYDILDIIPDLIARNLPGPCNGTNINGPGSYLTDYNEFNFTIDYRIIPGFNLKPGAYQIKIDFCLVEVP